MEEKGHDDEEKGMERVREERGDVIWFLLSPPSSLCHFSLLFTV